ncbi:MAG: DUF4157 domain-containing protein [Bradymonadales bacterium]|nr:DUF4157 domain-containing protein [Bradymonadales bacterium]
MKTIQPKKGEKQATQAEMPPLQAAIDQAVGPQDPCCALRQSQELRGAMGMGGDQGQEASAQLDASGAIPSVLQAKELQGAINGERARQVAAQGFSGTPQSLPYLDQLQQAFGSHDLSGVQAYVGGAASQASQAMGASSYASGNRVAFGAQPNLHTAAHEAAHVVQQRAGVSLAGGVGRAGDAYERQADAVADRVVQGKTAADLLGDRGGMQLNPAVQMEPEEPLLTAAKVNSAIGYNKGRKLPADVWNQIGGIVSASSGTINADLVNAIASWQASKGLGADGMVGNISLQWLSQESGGKGLEDYLTDNSVVYMGLNPDSRKYEMAHLTKVTGGKGVTGVTGSKEQDTTKVGSQQVDLTTEEGLEAYLNSLTGLDPGKKDKLKSFLERASEGSRDELSQWVQVLFLTETGKRLMKRVILSGHSGGWSISGENENETYISFSQLGQLTSIFPIAHGQVEDLMLSACNTAQMSKLDQYRQMFPNLKSIWGYVGYSPKAPATNPHIEKWEKGSRGKLDKGAMDKGRKQVAARGGKNDPHVALWTRDNQGQESYDTASEEAGYDFTTLKALVDNGMSAYNAAFEQGNIDQTALNQLYTSLQNLVGNFAYRLGAEQEKYEGIMKRTLYLRHWSKVSSKFMETFGTEITQAYGGAARTPKFATFSRSVTLTTIAAYPTPGDAAHKLLVDYLQNLDPSLIPDTWY